MRVFLFRAMDKETIMTLSKSCRTITQRYEQPIAFLLERYLETNRCAQAFFECGYEKDIYIDHVTPRTKLPLQEKAKIFERIGYRFICRYSYPKDGWFAYVYTFENQENRPLSYPYHPVIFTDKAYSFHGAYGQAARKNPIPNWIDEFPENNRENFLLHHVACRVYNIENAVKKMESDGHMFARKSDGSLAILSGYDGKLKQIFSKPEMLIGAKSKKLISGTVFELIYRHQSLNGWDFIKSQASDLMMKQSVESL